MFSFHCLRMIGVPSNKTTPELCQTSPLRFVHGKFRHPHRKENAAGMQEEAGGQKPHDKRVRRQVVAVKTPGGSFRGDIHPAKISSAMETSKRTAR